MQPTITKLNWRSQERTDPETYHWAAEPFPRRRSPWELEAIMKQAGFKKPSKLVVTNCCYILWSCTVAAFCLVALLFGPSLLTLVRLL